VFKGQEGTQKGLLRSGGTAYTIPNARAVAGKRSGQGCLRMRNIYEVLRQKELDVSRLQKEVEALRVAAPLLFADGEAENDNQPTLPHAVNATPQPDHSGWQDKLKNRWP
jgi:hypothetical protein